MDKIIKNSVFSWEGLVSNSNKYYKIFCVGLSKLWFYRDLFFNLSFIFLTEIFEICIKNVYLNKKSCENPCKMLGQKKTRSGYMNTVKSPTYKVCSRLVVTVFTHKLAKS